MNITREELIDFLKSDIVNACHIFDGDYSKAADVFFEKFGEEDEDWAGSYYVNMLSCGSLKDSVSKTYNGYESPGICMWRPTFQATILKGIRGNFPGETIEEAISAANEFRLSMIAEGKL